GSHLQQPFRETSSAAWVGDQHHIAAVSLHSEAALLDVEFVVDHHYRGDIVASRELGHQPMHPRLGTKARRAGWHLGNEENVEALSAHRSEFLDPRRGAARHSYPGKGDSKSIRITRSSVTTSDGYETRGA